jgi:hypothetical protein
MTKNVCVCARCTKLLDESAKKLRIPPFVYCEGCFEIVKTEKPGERFNKGRLISQTLEEIGG